MSNDRHTISQISLLLLCVCCYPLHSGKFIFFGDKLKQNRKTNRAGPAKKKIHEIKQTLRIYMARHLARFLRTWKLPENYKKIVQILFALRERKKRTQIIMLKLNGLWW